MKSVLLTGGTGFIGKALTQRLMGSGVKVRRGLRSPVAEYPASGCSDLVVGNIDSRTDWSSALDGVDTVVHLAARVHIMEETAHDPIAEFSKVNVDGTLNLARQAAGSGVRRFIFLSSIKVNGEQTRPGRAFRADDTPSPEDPYAVSKWEAEQRLMELAEESGMEVVIIRPPLVYGPGVKANFHTMMRWLEKGVPLPLGAIDNKRSLVALDNLVDLIVTCIDHPAAGNQMFLAGDGEDLSTTDLLRRLGEAMGKPAKLVPVPVWLLKTGAAVVGKRAVAERLCGSLQVDISKAREVLGWMPPVSVDEALRETARDFLNRNG